MLRVDKRWTSKAVPGESYDRCVMMRWWGQSKALSGLPFAMDSYINGLREVYWKHSKEGQNKAISHVAGLSFREKPHQLYSPEKRGFPFFCFLFVFAKKRHLSAVHWIRRFKTSTQSHYFHWQYFAQEHGAPYELKYILSLSRVIWPESGQGHKINLEL